MIPSSRTCNTRKRSAIWCVTGMLLVTCFMVLTILAGCVRSAQNRDHAATANRSGATQGLIWNVVDESLQYSANTAGIAIYPPPSVLKKLRADAGSRQTELVEHYMRRLSQGQEWVAAHVMLTWLTDHRDLGTPDRNRFGFYNGLKVEMSADDVATPEAQREEIARRWSRYLSAGADRG